MKKTPSNAGGKYPAGEAKPLNRDEKNSRRKEGERKSPMTFNGNPRHVCWGTGGKTDKSREVKDKEGERKRKRRDGPCGGILFSL